MNLRKTTRQIVLLGLVVLVTSCGGSLPEQGAAGEEELDCGEVTGLSYSKDILPILEENCLTCHNEENYSKKADGRLFEGYDNFKKYVDKGTVVKAVNHESGVVNMPYRKAKLDPCIIARIEGWVAEGSLNN